MAPILSHFGICAQCRGGAGPEVTPEIRETRVVWLRLTDGARGRARSDAARRHGERGRGGTAATGHGEHDAHAERRETPTDWDMTYGAERPATVEETATAAVEDAPIVDFTFG